MMALFVLDAFVAYGQEKKEKRDFSLRRPTHSLERMRKKKSVCFVRNDGCWVGGRGRGLQVVG